MIKPLVIGSNKFDAPVLLAPMAGITDAPFRAQVRRFGAALVCSEMVASMAFATSKPDVRAKAEIAPSDGLCAVQIAGRDPEPAAEAARVAEANGAALIDLNFGCPAKKVTSGAAGAALMREPDRALRIVEAAANAVSKPVTVKMRLGWDESRLNAAELVRGAADAGAQAATIHGRTRAQAYKGVANWRAIGEVVAKSPIPIVANGDIDSPNAAFEALRQSGAAGVMVGRGAQGAPWVPAQIMAALKGETFSEPSPELQLRLALEHHQAVCAFYGDELGLRAARKHLGWRLLRASDGAPWGENLRRRLVRLTDPKRVRALLEEAAQRLEDQAPLEEWSAAA